VLRAGFQLNFEKIEGTLWVEEKGTSERLRPGIKGQVCLMSEGSIAKGGGGWRKEKKTVLLTITGFFGRK